MGNFFLFIQLFTLIKLSIMQQKIRTKFKELFNTEGSLYTSPGRINLIGEHTDYNDGFVFPGAVQQGMIDTTRRSIYRTGCSIKVFNETASYIIYCQFHNPFIL